MRLPPVAYCGGRAVFRRLSIVMVLVAASGCAGGTSALGPGPDAPVPASEARQSVSFVVDLEPGSDCEQRFDLAVYENRDIDLIQWDEQTGSCHGRKVTIVYLSRHTDEAAVRALVEKHAEKVR